jgi:hypothetical protein
MAGGPGLKPVWRSGPGDPDYAVSARRRIVYTVSGPKSVVRGPLRGPGLPNLGPKPCRLFVFEPKPRSPDLLVPISTPAPDLAPRPYTSEGTKSVADMLGASGRLGFVEVRSSDEGLVAKSLISQQSHF